jgi:hypothetical protein
MKEFQQEKKSNNQQIDNLQEKFTLFDRSYEEDLQQCKKIVYFIFELLFIIIFGCFFPFTFSTRTIGNH